MNFREWTLGASFEGTAWAGDGQPHVEALFERSFTGIFGSQENKCLEMPGQGKTLAPKHKFTVSSCCLNKKKQ